MKIVPSASLLNYNTPYMEWLAPIQSVDTLFRFLVTANIQSGAYKYQTILEMRIEDLGENFGQFGNNGTALGTGGDDLRRNLGHLGLGHRDACHRGSGGCESLFPADDRFNFGR